MTTLTKFLAARDSIHPVQFCERIERVVWIEGYHRSRVDEVTHVIVRDGQQYIAIGHSYRRVAADSIAGTDEDVIDIKNIRGDAVDLFQQIWVPEAAIAAAIDKENNTCTATIAGASHIK